MSMESLFNQACQTMEQKVLAPVVLHKLAERGYKASNEAEATELLKLAASINEAVVKGEIAPIPHAELQKIASEEGLSKEASAKLDKDPLAFAPEFTIELDKVEPAVKEAAAIMALAGIAAK